MRAEYTHYTTNPANTTGQQTKVTILKYCKPKTLITKAERDTLVVLYALSVPSVRLQSLFKINQYAHEYMLGVARRFTDEEFKAYINGDTTLVPALLEEYYARHLEAYPPTPGSAERVPVVSSTDFINNPTIVPALAQLNQSSQVEQELS